MGCTRAADPGLKSAKNTILTIEPFATHTKKVRTSIEKEGHSLLLFAAADAEGHDVRF